MAMVATAEASLAAIATAVVSISLCKREGAVVVVVVVVIPPLPVAAARTAGGGRR
jgi:hypothetical protein